ncbi:STAS domain-containing protein [Actinoplanes sp. M2I2]|uniref:STAS domain-containing protein n=1 Tax=Actinoplanes sp. M2I2 TaxID=1734444 RepID=UPI0024C36B74|nr:STAS domain-containing protein [Actinoplanes sp. M2I2]
MTPLWSYTTHRDDDGSTVIVLTGELDLYCADALRVLLRDLLETGENVRLVADLCSVSFLDSAALGALITAFQHAQRRGGRFTVVNSTHAVRRILEIAGMLEILSPPRSDAETQR